MGIRNINQFHHSISPMDAITNQMFLIQACLKEKGVGGEIFSTENKGIPRDRAKPYSPEILWNCDLLLIHHSQGNPDLDRLLNIEIPKALIYHNITPAHFYRHDPKIHTLCKLGRQQLPLFKNKLVAAFSDSQYNRRELLGYGIESQHLPLVDLSEFKPPTRKKRRDRNSIRLLFVGRICPHKNQALSVRVAAQLKQITKKKVTLTLVGGEEPVYGLYLRGLIRDLGVSNEVVLKGTVSDTERNSLYQESDAFLCLSQHEGFCIPLVEAMAASLPIFAFPNTGAEETLQDTGVHLLSEDPAILAAILNQILEERRCLETVLEHQAGRLSTLAAFQNRSVLQSKCLSLLET